MGFKMNPGDALKKLNTEGTFAAKQADTMSKMNFDVISPINYNDPDREGGTTQDPRFKYNDQGQAVGILDQYGGGALQPNQASIDAARAGTGTFDPSSTSIHEFKGRITSDGTLKHGVVGHDGTFTRFSKPRLEHELEKEQAYVDYTRKKDEYNQRRDQLLNFQKNLLDYDEMGGVRQTKKNKN
jgi:hypothetical protein